MPETTRSQLSKQAVRRGSLKHQVEDVHNCIKEQRGEEVTLSQATPIEDQPPGTPLTTTRVEADPKRPQIMDNHRCPNPNPNFASTSSISPQYQRP
jgi:hypothetical protein